MGEELIGIVREFVDELLNVGNEKIADELLDPDFVSHGSMGDLGLEDFKICMQSWRKGFPDMDYRIMDIEMQGAFVCWDIRIFGTHTQECFGLRPTGRKLDVVIGNKMRANNGKPIEVWVELDIEDVLRRFR